MMKKSAIYIIVSVILLSSCMDRNPDSATGLVRRALGWDAVALEGVEFIPQAQEFTLDEPFKTGGDDERLFLTMEVENPQKWTVNPDEYLGTQTAMYWDKHVPNYVLNPQGQQTDIKMKLITKDGREFEVYPLTATNEGIELKFKYYHGFGEKIPNDVAFTRIIIRSSIPFKCQRLIWTRYTRI